MKVSKWGNSLAIRLSTEMVAELGVREGDELCRIPGLSEDGTVIISRKKTRREMLDRLAEIRKAVKWPADYKFNREELYDERFENWPRND